MTQTELTKWLIVTKEGNKIVNIDNCGFDLSMDDLELIEELDLSYPPERLYNILNGKDEGMFDTLSVALNDCWHGGSIMYGRTGDKEYLKRSTRCEKLFNKINPLNKIMFLRGMS